MKLFIKRMWTEDDGVLSFEWILLVTLLTIGIVGGIAAARDAIIAEFGDVAQAMHALDQSYKINYPLKITVHDRRASAAAANSKFVDNKRGDEGVNDCDRNSRRDLRGMEQGPEFD